MLVTQQPVLRRFWYPVAPVEQLLETPTSFELLGEKLVVWRNQAGQPAVLRDRCCHRSAQLSLGKIKNGNICCPYHGWSFDAEGHCVYVPQVPEDGTISSSYQIQAYRCCERYGYAWVCLADAPLREVPDILEANDPDFRLIHEFYEPWNCAGLRVMENEMDMAHPAYVHPTTFGSESYPTPDSMELEETEWGLDYRSTLKVVNPDLQKQNLKMAQDQTVRTMTMRWFMPFTVMLRIDYPNGLSHVIVNTMTPISDRMSQMVQFCLRNDSEAEVKASDVIAFDRAVTLEDKRILETTDYDVPLALTREQHMATDKPGILMRKKMAALLKTYGEVEQTRHRTAESAVLKMQLA
ncbi:MAG: aromatic ring-hydroxylating dioxygenase subunit alpha [Leptolyngbyaceae cyanobacterium SM1_1_3]|nr:aromatic ring-hydroxylating dioxygenase subunit alpha [Leptolyngbyaceae cyanobacterium SM1_1_3]NJN02449.1 aromatic ring-hydroxylating dioxygenase subunit alpha [Leptolyngbyaceae cyanobacterium RM1_1_2]NJO10460.1 aromatic ring-hydroxylating dioxygenase subunit alpha [Leptolyngbyaceae cyanobacterium SL_1_1]